MKASSAGPRVVLYGKPGCHLCEQAEADLARLRRKHPHTLEVIDISQYADLLERYGLRIPVLVVADREYDAPLDARTMERALENLRGSPAANASEPVIETLRRPSAATASEPAGENRRGGPDAPKVENPSQDPQHRQTMQATQHGA